MPWLRRLYIRLLRNLPARHKQERLWLAVANSDPARVFSWLLAGASPECAVNQPSMGQYSNLGIPRNVAITMARHAWNNPHSPECRVFRLVLRFNQQPEAFGNLDELPLFVRTNMDFRTPYWVVRRLCGARALEAVECMFEDWVSSFRGDYSVVDNLLDLRRSARATSPINEDAQRLIFCFSSPASATQALAQCGGSVSLAMITGCALGQRLDLLPLLDGVRIDWAALAHASPHMSVHFDAFRVHHAARLQWHDLDAITAHAASKPFTKQRL
jgi:hypothetical protein